jgi:hypothetical protein
MHMISCGLVVGTYTGIKVLKGSYSHVDVDVGDLRAAESALVVFDAGVFLAVVLQHLGQAEELDAAI